VGISRSLGTPAAGGGLGALLGSGVDGPLILGGDTVLPVDDNIREYTDITGAGFDLSPTTTNLYAVVLWTGTATNFTVKSIDVTARPNGGAANGTGGGAGGRGGAAAGAAYAYGDDGVNVLVDVRGGDGDPGVNGSAAGGNNNGIAGSAGSTDLKTGAHNWTLTGAVGGPIGQNTNAAINGGNAATGTAAQMLRIKRISKDFGRWIYGWGSWQAPPNHTETGTPAPDGRVWKGTSGAGGGSGYSTLNNTNTSMGGGGGGGGFGAYGQGGRGGGSNGQTNASAGNAGCGGGGGGGGGGGFGVLMLNTASGCKVLSRGGNGGRGGDSVATTNVATGGAGGGPGGNGVSLGGSKTGAGITTDATEGWSAIGVAGQGVNGGTNIQPVDAEPGLARVLVLA